MRKRIRKKKMIEIIIVIALFAGMLLWIYPYLWMILSSLQPSDEIFKKFWPTHFTLRHYTFLFSTSERLERPFGRALMNSFLVAGSRTIGILFSSVIVAYALAKLKFRGRQLLFNVVLYQMLFPGVMFIIPLFVLMLKLRLVDTYPAMIIHALMSAWAIFLITQSFKTVPHDYIDAARLDGASEFWIVFRLMVPICKSIVSIVALFTFISAWDDFLWPLIVVKDYYKMPMAVLIACFKHEYTEEVGALLAASTLQTIPMVALFIIFRKNFISGITMRLK